MTIKDQIGNTLVINLPLRRIVSLVPSITELLVDMGLRDNIVGITKFCIHPQGLKKNKKIIGGTKNIRINDIVDLKPDLVIANKEENDFTQISTLSQFVPVYVSDIKTYEDNFSLISDLSECISSKEMPLNVVNQLKAARPKASFNGESVLYLIWRDPYMSIGQDTYIHHMLQIIGLTNVVRNEIRYPQIKAADIAILKPNYIFLSSEPFPFKTKHLDELRCLSPKSKVVLVDGEIFSWYGSRIIKLPDYFEDLKTELS